MPVTAVLTVLPSPAGQERLGTAATLEANARAILEEGAQTKAPASEKALISSQVPESVTEASLDPTSVYKAFGFVPLNLELGTWMPGPSRAVRCHPDPFVAFGIPRRDKRELDSHRTDS